MKINLPEDDSRLSTQYTDGEECAFDRPSKFIDMSPQDMVGEDNLAEYIDHNGLIHIGSEILDGVKMDIASRQQLDENLKREVELAMQISTGKTYPFEGASDVKFPLVTIAVLQYTSRALAALYNNGRLVEARLPSGADKREASKREACKAVERDLAYELLDENGEWHEGMRKTLIAQGVVGNVYKKIYFDTQARRVQSVPVFADKLFFSAYSTSLETAPRVSEEVFYTKNDCFSKVAAGEWLKVPDWNDDYEDTRSDMDIAIDNRHGVAPSGKTEVDPSKFYEVYTWMDLDGDGYMEPIIVTIRAVDGFVCRIVANFGLEDIHTKSGRLISITKEVNFVKYGFIPSPNGSPYDFGFGRILYGINKAVNTGINQILDIAKWHANGGNGFIDANLGSQLQGRNRFLPGEWKVAKIMGMDMNKAIWAAPLPETPAELFQLIGFLVEYGDRVSGSTEVRSGQNVGQNTKVGTIDTLVEEGATIFNQIYATTRYAFTKELRHIFRLKKRYFDDYDRTIEEEEIASWSQYELISSIKAGCPLQYTSQRDENKKATTALSVASSLPTAHNMANVLEDFYDSIDPDMAERYLLRDPKSPSGIPTPPNPDGGKEQAQAQVKMQELQLKGQELQLKQQDQMANQQFEAALTQAKVALMQAQAANEIDDIRDSDVGHKLALLNAIIGLNKTNKDHQLKAMEFIKGLRDEQSTNESGSSGLAGASSNASAGEEAPTGIDDSATEASVSSAY